jgi:DNA replication protein DnaC
LIVSRSPIPDDFKASTLQRWESLVDKAPAAMAGKYDALGAIKAFIANRNNGYFFTPKEAALNSSLKDTPPDIDATTRKNWIVLAGPNGVGKTSLAVAGIQSLRAGHIPGLFARLFDMLAAIKESYTPDDGTPRQYNYGDDEAQILSLFQNAPVLAIDEFGLAQYTDWRLDIVEQLIRFRSSRRKPTIITTNLSYTQIAHESAWGPTIGHAIHGAAHWYEMGGQELRQRTGPVQSR